MHEEALQATFAALTRMAGSSSLREECLAEALLATARRDATVQPRVRAMLEGVASPSVIARAWLPHLMGLPEIELRPVDVPERCPARTRLLLQWDELHLLREALGTPTAWRRWRALRCPGVALLHDDGLGSGSPFVGLALRTAVDLSAAAGRWQDHEQLLSEARHVAREGTVGRIALELTYTRALLRRDRRQEALEHARRWSARPESQPHADLMLAWEALILETLVGAGREVDFLMARASPVHHRDRDLQLRDAWRRAFSANRRIEEGDAGTELYLTSEECRGWWGLASSAATRAGLQGAVEFHDDDLGSLLLREHAWRGPGARRVPEGRELIEDIEAYLLERRYRDVEQRVQAALARCRLRVDVYGPRTSAERRVLRKAGASSQELKRISLGALEELRSCDSALGECIELAAAHSLAELEIQAHDQRTVVLARLEAKDEADAATSRACERVLELLRTNTSNGDERPVIERGLLERLWPIIDRGIEVRVRQVLPQRGQQEWTGAGTEIYRMVEQSAALSLEEVRRVHAGRTKGTVPHRFAWAPPDDVTSTILAGLQARLGPRELLLQYFVSTRFILVFAIDRERLTWEILGPASVPGDGVQVWWEKPLLDESLASLAEGCWSASNLELLSRAIWARAMEVEANHVLVVPHGALWDVPFSSMPLDHGDRLGARVALSTHSCGRGALDALERRGDLRRRGGHHHGLLTIGRDLDHEVASVLGRLGYAKRWSVSNRESLHEMLTHLQSHSLVDLVCHGTSPDGSESPGRLELGADDESISVVDVSSLRLEGCRVLILMACYGARPSPARREDPVLGFPQALLDAGVAAVIAARYPIPQLLVAPMLDQLHLLLRFLPIEEALRRCMISLHEGGRRTLARGGAQGQKTSLTSFFDPEFRVHGIVGRHANDRWPGRIWARVVWWRRLLERRLARRAKHPGPQTS